MKSRDKIICRERKRGIALSFRGKDYDLTYPGGIWQAYPRKAKDFFIDNITFAQTVSLPLVSGIKTLNYGTSAPALKPFFDSAVVKNIPAAVDGYKVSTAGTIRQFINTGYIFSNGRPRRPHFGGRMRKNRVIVSFSMGKDSMLTLAVCRELGLEPVGVYINDTVSPGENGLKIKYMKEIALRLGVRIVVVTNETEQLNDFENWSGEETCIGYVHMIPAFAFALLPVARYFRAGHIILGNEQNMNFPFFTGDGYRAYPSFDQSAEGTADLDGMIKLSTGGKVGVSSIIEPLSSIAIMKILHQRYKNFANYQVSCDCLDTVRAGTRWCGRCRTCAKVYILLKANGVNPADAGLKRNMLGRDCGKYFSLFNGSEIDGNDRSEWARDEILLTFYMAYKKGARGWLIEKFKKRFLKEAGRREKELRGKFLTAQGGESIPPGFRKKVLSIYESELKKP
ncbi:MAG: hypothetical protein ABIH68_06065 [bacterium]